MIRNKKSVIKSLVTRDKFSEELAGAIYDYYNYSLVETLSETEALAINFEDYAKNEVELSNMLSAFLKIPPLIRRVFLMKAWITAPFENTIQSLEQALI